MSSLFVVLLFWPQAAPSAVTNEQLIERIARSGRALDIAPAAERIADPSNDVAPGAPPMLAFRYFDGADRHRFGKLDLMIDDAGH